MSSDELSGSSAELTILARKTIKILVARVSFKSCMMCMHTGDQIELFQ